MFKSRKIPLIILGIVIFLIIIIASMDSPVSDSDNIDNVSYEVIKQWDIPNGGLGKTILIDPSLVNENDMAKLGKTLNSDFLSEKNAFVFIYSDRQAAIDRDTVDPENMSEDYINQNLNHFVGSYTKNSSSNINELTAYLEGAQNTDSYKTFSY